MSEEAYNETIRNFRETASVLLEKFSLGAFSIVRAVKNMSNVGETFAVSLEGFSTQIYEREEKFGDFVGFIHSHPPGCEYISEQDLSAAQGYSFEMGKRILMIIETPSGWHQAWYVNDEGNHRIAKILRLPFGFFAIYLA